MMVAVAFLTFGLITPTHEIWDTFDVTKLKDVEVRPDEISTTVIDVEETSIFESVNPRQQLLDAARQQSYIKFGTRIAPKISHEFESVIYPKIQEAIDMTLAQVDQQTVQTLAISENPSGDYAEKMFNIYRTDTGEDMIRFHVRTENRPFDGYYYNFHYHTADDAFVTHYSLGEIYWSKNTPPKWLS